MKAGIAVSFCLPCISYKQCSVDRPWSQGNTVNIGLSCVYVYIPLLLSCDTWKKLQFILSFSKILTKITLWLHSHHVHGRRWFVGGILCWTRLSCNWQQDHSAPGRGTLECGPYDRTYRTKPRYPKMFLITVIPRMRRNCHISGSGYTCITVHDIRLQR
jgi:hypothetical protein